MTDKTSILMIGGTGVISTDCTRLALQNPEFKVTLLNRGTTPNLIGTEGNYQVIQADANDENALRESLRNKTFDIVCDFITFNLESLQKHLKSLRGHCRHYVFISSVMAYRANDHMLKTEANSSIGNTDWVYGWDKSLCERYIRTNCPEFGMTYTIIRPGYTFNNIRFFSPWSIAHNRSWTIAERMLKGKPIILQEDGMQLCTITHTTDFAKAFVGLFNNPAAVNNDFHLTSREYITWKRVAEIQAEILGVKPIFKYLPAEEICYVIPFLSASQKVMHCTHHDCYDSSKARAAVPEFKCTTSFEEGIAQTINFYRKHPDFQVIDPTWADIFDKLEQL